MQHKVDVILLTYKPSKQVMKLIEALETQTYPIHKIILMNTEEKYFEALFYGTRFLEKYITIYAKKERKTILFCKFAITNSIFHQIKKYYLSITL